MTDLLVSTYSRDVLCRQDKRLIAKLNSGALSEQIISNLVILAKEMQLAFVTLLAVLGVAGIDVI